VRLAKLAPHGQLLLADGFDHQNVEACPQYLPRLKAFLAHVEQQQQQKQQQQQQQQQQATGK
jgi:hypothetical protein